MLLHIGNDSGDDSIATETKSGVTIGCLVKTPYGNGRVVSTYQNVYENSENVGVILDTHTIQFCDWGGTLYCTDDVLNTFAIIKTMEGDKLANKVALLSPALPNQTFEAISWRKLSAIAMVSMISTLEFMSMVDDLMISNYDSWDLSHFECFLSALECVHHHARAFNENKYLRNQLKLCGFMEFPNNPDKLPHLLDQELTSLSCIINIILRLYKEGLNDGDVASSRSQFAFSLVKRLVFNIY